MDFQDRPLQCIDCKNEFVFTAGEQEFYEKKGFREIPKRCKPCREARKARRSDGGERNGERGERGERNNAAPQQNDRNGARPRDRDREMFDAVCASCGAPARVPFRPASGRPVYCRECYSSRQGQGSGYGGGY
ncbi:MAG TPA: zinc-ribbon domain containing protein [Polyangia bacterium]|nr:zinc-ribbon domain containing protein [Polyangia bacterium]